MIKLRLKEFEDGDPNSQVGKLLTKFSKYLEDEEDIYVTDVDYSTKTVYVDTIKDLKSARYILRTEFPELRQKGCHVQSSIGTDGLNKDYIMDTKTQTESLDNDFEEYTYIKSKEVYDYDGFRTEYTMYYDEIMDRYVFVFGDSDMYNPNDGYEEFDFECDTEKEANEWFDNYNGFEDDLDESCITKESSDIWDVNTAAKQSADAALKNIKQGIKDFEIEINTKVDRPNFWKQFRKEMTENGLDFEIKGKDTEWDDHYYYMYLYTLNDDLDESICNEALRYYVTDDDYIPLKAQPDEGYTKLQAIQRAQREAEQDSKLFKISMSDAVKGYHIMDSNNKILHDLDNAI